MTRRILLLAAGLVACGDTKQPGDTVDGFGARMRGVDKPTDLFRILNEIKDDGVLPAPGQKVKIVAE